MYILYMYLYDITCTCMILHVCIVLLQLHVDCIDKNVHHSMNVCPQGASFSVCVFSFDCYSFEL